MPREFSRSQRVADQMHRELASILQTEMKDARLGFLTINAVELGPDMACAKVYVTSLGGEGATASKEAVAILEKAARSLRAKLSSRMRMRVVPRLRFSFDDSLDRADHISRLLKRAVAEDAAAVGERSDEEQS